MATTSAPRRRRRSIAVAACVSLALGLVGAAAAAPAVASDNGAADKPIMGWSTWSFLRKNVNETNVKAQAKAMKDSGLLAAGYNYVNLDDFWYLNPTTTVDENGFWKVDPAVFPSGMKSLADYIHGLGEKFGMYVTPGVPVAAYNQNLPIAGTSFHIQDIVSNTTDSEANYNFGNGSMYYVDWDKNPAAAQAYFNNWANLLATWDIDYIKIDGVGWWDKGDVIGWSKALRQTGRTIHVELSNGLSSYELPTWQEYTNGWRVDGDVECYCSNSSYPLTSWERVSWRFADVMPFIGAGGPGGWNDLDSIEIGNGRNNGLTLDERQTVMTLWSIENSHLLLGTDLTNLDAKDMPLLTNQKVLAVDQAGHPARPVDRVNPLQAWYAPNGDGSYTVALFNLSSKGANVSVNWKDIGFTGSAATIYDTWAQAPIKGTFATSYTKKLPSHGSALLKVTPTGAVSSTAMSYNIVNSLTGLNMAVTGNSTASGAGIEQQPADNALDQKWQIIPNGDDSYRLVNRNSSLALSSPSATAGAQLTQKADAGAKDTQWRLKPDGQGGYAMTSLSSGLAADDDNLQTAAGTPVVQSAKATGANQVWTLVPAPDAGVEYRIENGATGGRLDVYQDSTADLANIVQWQDNNAASQQWTFVKQADGSYTIVNANSGKLINIPGPTTAQGTQLIQYHDDGGINGHWKLLDKGPGFVAFESVYDGQLIDVDHSYATNGATILQWPSNGGVNQKWMIIP